MWTETGNAPDQNTGGTWHYYRLDGNNMGFIGTQAYTATIAYNKTVLTAQNGQNVAAQTHVTAHVTLTDRATNTVQNIDVRYYYDGQDVVNGANAIPVGNIRDYVVDALAFVSGF